ncbi:MAG TPA: hypothetical protein VF432_10345 [Thermoanaerobaculia bacterium]
MARVLIRDLDERKIERVRRRSFFLPLSSLAVALDRTVYDSLYLALAVAEECVLVTADAKFHATIVMTPLAAHVQWVEEI